MALKSLIALQSAFLLGLIVVACSGSGTAPTSTPTETSDQAPAPTATPPSTPVPSTAATSTGAVTPTPTPQLEALFQYTRAVRLLEAAMYEEAIPAFGLVIRRLPNLAEAYQYRGRAYFHEEQPALALEDFDRAIELKPELADAYKNRAILYSDQGKTEQAIADLEKALTLYNRDRDARDIIEVFRLLNELRP